ncbi:MAG: SIR2 family protein [Xanthobacteraceae bacterium]
MMGQTLRAIDAGLGDGLVIPYLGPEVLALAGEDCPLPGSPRSLVDRLGEEFSDRKTVTKAMGAAFLGNVQPTVLHNYLAALPTLPLIVHDWYDDLPRRALAVRSSWSVWGMVQGVSRATRAGHWVHYLQADGTSAHAIAPDLAETWATLLYEPLGSVAGASSFHASEGDFVEILAERDYQASIPEPVQNLRIGRHFLFLGCRFTNDCDQKFTRQIMNCSSAVHWAVLPETPTREETRFLAEQNIKRIDLPLADFVAALTDLRHEERIQLLMASW